MKLLHLFFLAVAAIGSSNAQAQDGGAGPSPAPNPDATLNYIHSAWDTLTRSMTDCHSLADVKVTANPIMYVPAEMTIPPELDALKEK
jgi:alpha,alpha-trehalase